MDKYSPIYLTIKGNIVNLKTKEPMEKQFIYFSERKMDEINFQADEVFSYTYKTNRKGEIIIRRFLDKKNLQFWLKIEEFAQVNVILLNEDTTNFTDTIDIGTIYFIPYDNELEVVSYNMPKSKKKTTEQIEKYSITQVDSIFNQNNKNFQMTLNPIDTVEDWITRYNFGPNKSRGTTIKAFKQVTIQKSIGFSKNL